MDLFRDGFTQVTKLGLAAESKNALDDAAFFVEQDGVRQPAIMICVLQAAAANEDRKWWPEFPHECAHLAAADVVRNGGDIEIRTRELAVQLRHVGKFLPARAA